MSDTNDETSTEIPVDNSAPQAPETAEAKPSIAELEAILNDPDAPNPVLNPDGSLGSAAETVPQRPDQWEAVTSTPAGHTFSSTSIVVGGGVIIATNLTRAQAEALVDAHNG